MNSALLSRFDLVFILLDKPDAEMDAHISEHIMKVHSGAGKGSSRAKWAAPGQADGDSQQSESPAGIEARLTIEGGFDPIPPSLLRKYVAYARNYCHPVLTKEAAAVLQNFYLDLREKVKSN
jgi:DNA helicase MCM8